MFRFDYENGDFAYEVDISGEKEGKLIAELFR